MLRLTLIEVEELIVPVPPEMVKLEPKPVNDPSGIDNETVPDEFVEATSAPVLVADNTVLPLAQIVEGVAVKLLITGL